MIELLVGNSLFAVLLKASIALALAQLIVAALPRLSAALKHLILTAGLGAFVVIPLLAIIGPEWQIGTVLMEPAPQRWIAAPADEAPHAPPPVEPVHILIRLDGLLVCVWFAITMLFVVRLARTALRLRSIVATASAPSPRLVSILEDVRSSLGVDAPVRLLRSDRVHVPMVWGVRSGTLLVPELADDWSDEELRATFIHELGHLQRLDYVSLALMNIVAALLWFHPQVWLARRRAMIEGERACDDLVLRAGERASAYASHLLHVARLLPHREPLSALLAMSRPSQLEGRMHAILSPSTNRKPLRARGVFIALMTFASAIAPLAFLQLSAQTVMTPVREMMLVSRAPVAVAAAATPVGRTVASAPQVRVAAAPIAIEPIEQIALAALPEPKHSLPVVADPILPAEVVIASEPQPLGMRILTDAELASGNYNVLTKLAATSCTYRLRRPVNTGDPSRNPAEALAISRLLSKATEKGADAVANVKCYRYVMIGIGCPSGVECTGDAVAMKSWM